MWDEKRVRRVTLRKGRPGADDVALIVGGRFAAFRDNRNYDPEVRYALEREGALETLEGVQWADWDASGRLLVATSDGRLLVRGDTPASAASWEVDLSADEPDPQAPPDEARRW